MSLDEHKSVGTHWIGIYVNGHNETCFHSFGVEYIQKEVKRFIGNKNFTTIIYRIQANESKMCG